jgi:hypothetical protein
MLMSAPSPGAARPDRAAAWWVFLLVTVIEASPETAPTLAVIVPLPVLVAVKVAGLPGFGEKVPSAGDTDQLGVTATEFP